VNIGSLLAAIVTEELKGHRDEKVYFDLRFSKSVAKAIELAGGEAVKTKVGNPFYKQQLINYGGLMGAEMSGHFMYKENYCLDDGLFSALKVLYWLSETGKKMSNFVEPFSKNYFVSSEINLEVENPEKIISELEKKYADGTIEHLDGVTIEFPDWWFNLRSSNTEPLVRLNIEAKSDSLLKEKIAELKNYIK
jgi:phosphomannomutase